MLCILVLTHTCGKSKCRGLWRRVKSNWRLTKARQRIGNGQIWTLGQVRTTSSHIHAQNKNIFATSYWNQTHIWDQFSFSELYCCLIHMFHLLIYFYIHIQKHMYTYTVLPSDMFKGILIKGWNQLLKYNFIPIRK